MNIFNRFILLLLLFGLIVILTIVLIFPSQILTGVGQFLLDWGEYFTWLDQQQQLLRLVINIGIAFIVDLILALLIYLEIKPKRKRFIKVQQVSGGTATVSLDSIVRQLLYRLDPLPGVVKVIPVVKPKGNKIQTRLDISVTRELAVPQMADYLISTAKRAINDDLGLVVSGEPQLRIKVIEGERRGTTPSSSSESVAQPDKLNTPPSPRNILSTTPEENLVPPVSTKDDSVKENDDWA